MSRSSSGTEKYLTVTYRSNGEVDLESNNMTVFDLWALARFIELRADEIYITKQTELRMKEAANQSPLVTSTMMPRGPGKATPLREQ